MGTDEKECECLTSSRSRELSLSGELISGVGNVQTKEAVSEWSAGCGAEDERCAMGDRGVLLDQSMAMWSW